MIMAEITDVVSLALTLFLCILFATAAVHKLNPRNREYYQKVISGYFSSYIIDMNKSPANVFLLGGIEIALAICLLLPFSRTLSALAGGVLLLGYTLLMARSWYQGHRDQECGCSGPATSLQLGPGLVIRNLVLALLSFCVAMAPVATSIGTEFMLILAFTLAIQLIYVSVENLLANAQRIASFRDNLPNRGVAL